MDLYPALYAVAKLLLSEKDRERTPEILLREVLAVTGAERGFIVVQEGDSYVEKHGIRFDRETISSAERRFSRTLVREAIETKELIYCPNLAADPRFAKAASAQLTGGSAVVAAPLHDAGQVFGVIYLQFAAPLERVGADVKTFLVELSQVGGANLRRGIEHEALHRRARSLEHDLFAQHDFAGIVTRDARMMLLLRTVAQVADSGATVLVRGETGTGKELIARALHANSPRRERSFVPIHCAALPATILESELFGHVRGAFSGADRDRPGRIAAADGGTLFLDEVGEIPRDVQAKLLRFLQFGEVQRVGSDRPEKVDVRVVAATHQDLAALTAVGGFREDVYFRLRVIELTIPPLRERRGDIPLLLDHFLRQHWRRKGEAPRWSPDAERALYAHEYTGNVRELAHLVERACLLAGGPVLDVDALPPEVRAATPDGGDRFQTHTNDELLRARAGAVEDAEREFLDGLMKKHGGNVSQAARAAGMQRGYLQKLLARHRERA